MVDQGRSSDTVSSMHEEKEGEHFDDVVLSHYADDPVNNGVDHAEDAELPGHGEKNPVEDPLTEGSLVVGGQSDERLSHGVPDGKYKDKSLGSEPKSNH